MRVLIVEDTEAKMKVIEECIKTIRNDWEFTEARSYSDGIQKIYERGWNLILLDMSLPTYTISHTESGGTKKPVAGKEIMKRMLSREIYIPVIIITQFDTFGDNQISLESLTREFENDYTKIWKGTISYDKPGWQDNLYGLIYEMGK